MDDLFEDFLKGEEVKSIKTFLNSLPNSELAVLVAAFVGALALFPKLTICATLISIGSLFVAHAIKKWTK